jgi:crotonobetainyl-CoA:carnitine CoA-transferase CaiB-like acyl-CoA transferase
MLTATANRYPCGDGKWIVLNMPEPSAWERLARALGREDLLEQARFIDPRSRYRNMPELVAIIDTTLATKSRDEWGNIFDATGLIWGPVLGLHEVIEDPQAQALGLFPELHSDTVGAYRTVNIPMRFANADVRPRGPSPTLGQHTRELLTAAGLTDVEVDSLLEQGAIGAG